MTLVSIIVPVYNVEKYLRECLESVVNQTLKNIEIILVNDGSTDKSLEICKEYVEKDKRIKLINKDNGGLSSARNAGIDMAKGKYIGFIDSDDWIDLTMYKEMYDIAEKTNVDMVFCNFNYVNANFKRKSEFTLKEGVYKENKNRIIENLLYRNSDYIPQFAWNKLYRYKIIEEFKMRYDEDIKPGEDYVFTLEYLLHCKSVYSMTNHYLYNYRYNPTSITNSYIPNLWLAQKNIYRRIMELVLKHKNYDFFQSTELQLLYRSLSVIRNETNASSNKTKSKIVISNLCTDPELRKVLTLKNILKLSARDKIYILLIKSRLSTLISKISIIEVFLKKILK